MPKEGTAVVNIYIHIKVVMGTCNDTPIYRYSDQPTRAPKISSNVLDGVLCFLLEQVITNIDGLPTNANVC